jgi:hypothetical protein
MKNILLKQFRHGEKLLYLSILITFSIIAYHHLSIGYRMSPDSYTYSGWADDLIKLNFNLYNYYAQNTFWTPSFFYTIPVAVVALLKVFFGNGWQYGFLALNLSLVLFSLVIFSKSLLIIGVRPIIISITMAILVVSVDLLIWPRYILSDTIFSFLVILITYIMIRGIIMDKTYYISLISIMCIVLFSRPSSLPILFAIFAFILISRFHIYNKPKLLLLLLFVALLVITPLIFSYLNHYMSTNLRDIVQVKWLLDQVNLGMIIHDRPETWISPPSSFIDVAYLYFIRMISFFTPYAEPFSTIHIVLNSLQTFVILLSITIWSFLGGNVKAFDKTVLFILLLSFSVAAYQAFTIIDYDWRYRFPLILPLIMIFPISMEILFKRIISE